MNVPTAQHGTPPVLTGSVYLVLFLLGAAEGLVGSFQYLRTAGSVPLAAIAFCLTLLVTCVLAGWGMRSVSGALVPAIGWLITSFLLSMPVRSGSVIITASTPGEWYLYGGTLSALTGVGASFGRWIRTARPR
ncbi:MAG: hypothetical protein M3Z75_26690 [Actinomycetota bacterium]|nr:hypothetical protein [Actinomycetota bacterium]